jgi:hypothetical protein
MPNQVRIGYRASPTSTTWFEGDFPDAYLYTYLSKKSKK